MMLLGDDSLSEGEFSGAIGVFHPPKIGPQTDDQLIDLTNSLFCGRARQHFELAALDRSEFLLQHADSVPERLSPTLSLDDEATFQPLSQLPTRGGMVVFVFTDIEVRVIGALNSSRDARRIGCHDRSLCLGDGFR